MKVFGVSMVHNEADIVRVTVLHHLSLGLDRILILDNGSTDGTDRILRDLAREDERVRWTRDDSPYDQTTLTTGLARQARRQGADWVLPFDADEFWWTGDKNLKEILEHSKAGALRVSLVNFVQARHQHDCTPEGLLTMTRRAAHPVGPGAFCRELVESRKIGFVEMVYPSKWISRPTREVEVHRGNHKVTGIRGRRKECNDIVCLHAPLRSRTNLKDKSEHSQRLDEAGIPRSSDAWHIRYWERTNEEGLLDQEWAANSYEADHLDVYGERHEVVFDPRLRDVVVPLVPSRSRKTDSLHRRVLARATSALRRTF